MMILRKMKIYVFISPKPYMATVLDFLNDWRKTEMGIKDYKLHKYDTKVTNSTSEGLTILKNNDAMLVRRIGWG